MRKIVIIGLFLLIILRISSCGPYNLFKDFNEEDGLKEFVSKDHKFKGTMIHGDCTSDNVMVLDGAEILCRAALSDTFRNASGKYFDNDIGEFTEPHPVTRDNEKRSMLVQQLDAIIGK